MLDLKHTSSHIVVSGGSFPPTGICMASEPATSEGFFVCTLPSPELASRRAEIQRLIEHAGSVTARPDGVLFTFPNADGIAHALLDFIRFEQQCCGAITYELRSVPPHT